MPELFRMFGMKFFFFSLEHKPVHIHVRNGDGKAKFDIIPEITLIEAKGMKPKDLVLAEAVITEKKEEIIKKWNEIHGESKPKNNLIMKIENVWFDDINMYVKLNTGHIIGNPISWFARLKTASHEELLKFEIDTFGESIHWENLDEDLSLESLFDFKHELNYAKI